MGSEMCIRDREETEESDEETAEVDSDHDESSEEVIAPTSDDAFEETPSTDAPSAAVDAEGDFDGADESVMNDDILVEDQPSARSAFGVAAADANSHQAPILDDESHDVLDSLASKAGDTYAEASNAVSEAIHGTPLSPGEKISSDASQKYSDAVAA